MDPNANLESQLELAREISADSPDADNIEAVQAYNERQEMRADQLAEHVTALHEWILSGGFLPEVWPVSPRALALGRLIEQRGHVSQIVVNGPNSFTLANYWVVLFQDGFECGIAPDGSVSS